MKTLKTNYTLPAGAPVPHWQHQQTVLNHDAGIITARFSGFFTVEAANEKKPPLDTKTIQVKFADIDLTKNIPDQLIAIFSKEKCFEGFTVKVS